jgi:hypothetical protein
MGSLVHYASYGKKMLGWIREKMVTQESALGGGRFSVSDSIVVRNGPSKFPHTMLNVKMVKHNMQLAFIEKFSPIARLGLACRQDTYVSRVCRMRAKATCMTLVMFNCGKLWPGFGVTIRNSK